MPASLFTLLLIGFGGAIGAVSRFAVVLLAQKKWGEQFPFGTLFVNVLGSFLMGLIAVLMVHRMGHLKAVSAFMMIGFLGAFTTYSSFSLETLDLYQRGEFMHAIYNIVLNVVLCLAFVALGASIGRKFF